MAGAKAPIPPFMMAPDESLFQSCQLWLIWGRSTSPLLRHCPLLVPRLHLIPLHLDIHRLSPSHQYQDRPGSVLPKASVPTVIPEDLSWHVKFCGTDGRESCFFPFSSATLIPSPIALTSMTPALCNHPGTVKIIDFQVGLEHQTHVFRWSKGSALQLCTLLLFVYLWYIWPSSNWRVCHFSCFLN